MHLKSSERLVSPGMIAVLVGMAPLGIAAPSSTPTPIPTPIRKVASTLKKPIYVIVDKKHIFMPLGTKVPLELETYLSGNKSKADEPVDYKVTADVLSAKGDILIAKDAPAKGRVTFSKKASGLMNKGSKLSFDAEYVTAVDGSQVPLIFKMVLQTKSGLGMTMLGGFGKGRNHKVKAGTKFEAVVGIPVPDGDDTDDVADTKTDTTKTDVTKTDAKTK